MKGGRNVKRAAFATTDEGQAWTFAENAQWEEGGRSSVLKVGHHPEEEEGKYHENSKSVRAGRDVAVPGETTAPSFPVQERIDIKPGHQGTFPQLNWQQFSRQRGEHILGDEMNHPSPHDVEHGHESSRRSEEMANTQRQQEEQTRADEESRETEKRTQRRLF
jgi:hypothetical protein